MSLTKGNKLLCGISTGKATDTNFEAAGAEVLKFVSNAVEIGLDIVQLREKQLSALKLFELTLAASNITKGSETKLLVNDRADIALAAGADGVQLAANSLPVADVRKFLPAGSIIGVSTHGLEEVQDAERNGADFAIFGTVFESFGKKNVQGLSVLSDVCQSLAPFPVIAIGGIDEANFENVFLSGASGIAGIRSFNDAELLKKICQRINNG